MKEKLHIPGSADEDHLNELSMVLVLGWAACMLLCIGLFFFFRERRPPTTLPDAQVAGQPAANRTRSAGAKTPEERTVETFRFGPRAKAETACTALSDQLARGDLARAIDLELIKVVDRQATYAPWTCLVGAFLNDKISDSLAIHQEMGRFWESAQNFDAPSQPGIASALLDFSEQPDPPQRPDFVRWLRLCAMNPRAGARSACLTLLQSTAPAQGSDVLDMIEKHLQTSDPEALSADMELVVAGLRDAASNAQPPEWRVTGAEAVADYQGALRIGAAFMLCRLVNAPDATIAAAAALGLAEAATMAARTADVRLVRRWRESCEFAFTTYAPTVEQDDAGQDADAPEFDHPRLLPTTPGTVHPLAIWSGVEGERPDYSLHAALARGACAPQEPRPLWHCGVDFWQAPADTPFDRALQNFFIKTSYVEWLDF